MPIDQTLRIGVEIADALDKAHRQGIVHRDLKPGNVMLTKSGVKLLDFGLAKTFERSLDATEREQAAAEHHPMARNSLTALPTVAGSANLTQEGTILGTFQYMAPEQLEGKDADGRTDIFAFGATLYEMLTGRKPFDGASAASVTASILTVNPPLVSSAVREEALTPPAIDHIVRRALAKNPDERWQTARDLMLELRWILDGNGQKKAPARPIGAGCPLREAGAAGRHCDW